MLSRCRPLLGTFVEISADRDDAVEAAFAAVERVHRLMSAHQPDSDVSRINRRAHEAPVIVDPWTIAVLERAQFWSRHSDGAFDVVRAGKLAVDAGYLPRHADQPHPSACHWAELEIDGNAAQLARAGCVDLGGIAKGFAVDKAVEALRSAGAEYGLVNAGGDLAGFGHEWPATIVEPTARRPVAEVTVEDDAIATSAVDGASSHLPGRDDRYVSATVRAPTCIDADALAKVLISGTSRASHCLSLVDADGFVITSSLEAIAA